MLTNLAYEILHDIYSTFAKTGQRTFSYSFDDDDPAEEPDMDRLDILFKEACDTCRELSAAATMPNDGSKLRDIMRVIRDHDDDVMAVIQAMIKEFKTMQKHEDHLVHVIRNRFDAMDRIIDKLDDRVDDIKDAITDTEDD